MKKMYKASLALLTVGMCFAATACLDGGDGPQFLEGAWGTIKIGNTLVLAEYVDYVTEGDYTIEIQGENGYSKDVTRKKAWQPEEPGSYQIVYTVKSGEFKGVSKFDIEVVVPKVTWAYSANNNFYTYGEPIDFEEFFDEMNISAKSYYSWEMVMDSVVVDGQTITFEEGTTEYVVDSFSPHTFYYHLETEDGQTREGKQMVEIRYIDEETMSYLEENNIHEYNAVTIAEGRVELKAGQYGGGNTTGAPRTGMRHEQAYLYYDGEYGIGDFIAFDYTGNNMPAIGFFVEEPSDSMFTSSLERDDYQKGFVVANGFTQNDGKPFAKWATSLCSRFATFGPQRISHPDTDTEGWFRSSIRNVPAVGMTYQANNPDTKFRMVLGFVEGDSTHATLAYYLCDRETGEVYYKGQHTSTFDGANLILPVDENYYTGKIVAWGQYGKKTVLDKVYPIVHANSLDEAIYTLFKPAQLKATASLQVPANEPQNVSDYIVTVPGYTPTLKIMDAEGNVTEITGSTFTLPAVGEYTLIYDDGKNSTLRVKMTAGTKYEIDTVEEFMNMATGDEYAYYVLTKDIDFAGTLIQYNATPEGNLYAPIGTGTSKFSGVLDGNGHSIYNVTVSGNGNAIFASVFAYVDGTIKNLAVDMKLKADVASVKDSGFIYSLYAGASVENCYVKYTSHCTQYKNGNGRAIAAIASCINANGGVATIKNCVGVMDLSAGVTHPATPFGGAATIIGGNTSTSSTADVINCYGVMLTADSDSVHTAKIDSNDTTSASGVASPGKINKDTSAAYDSFANMFAAAQTDMTEENGWNSCWNMDAANERLTFGSKVLYNARAPYLNVESANLYATESGTTLNGLAQTLQLNVVYATGAITYVSSDPSVATVDANGLVTAVNGGKATISATVDGNEYTCEVTVYNYQAITTAAEFMAMSSDAPYAYYALTRDIDFTGITVGSASHPAISNFVGVLDGNGYKIHNVTLIGATGNGIQASLFLFMNGTIKNLSAELGFSADIPAKTTKHAGLIATISLPTAVVENCYVKLSSKTASYGTQIPVASIVSYVSPGAYAAVIRNCVAVFECLDDFAAINGGYATIAGRVAAVGLTIENCYGVVLSKDNAQAAKLYCDSTYDSSYKTPQIVNSTAHTTLAEMFTAAQTGMTVANGWNSFWAVDAENNTLKFGQTVIYQAA